MAPNFCETIFLRISLHIVKMLSQYSMHMKVFSCYEYFKVELKSLLASPNGKLYCGPVAASFHQNPSVVL